MSVPTLEEEERLAWGETPLANLHKLLSEGYRCGGFLISDHPHHAMMLLCLAKSIAGLVSCKVQLNCHLQWLLGGI